MKNSFDRVKYRIRIWQALKNTPPFRSEMNRIIIDLTHYCNLSCTHCNRSCGEAQAPAIEMISKDQISRFVSESIAQNKRWKRIWLEGGEPTLHPELTEIMAILIQYKSEHSPDCQLLLCTNGYGNKAEEILKRLPQGIQIKNSHKSPGSNNKHFPFNIAPSDLPEYTEADFTQGCYIHTIFGLGLNKYGYYPHPICGSIDRVFGFDIGLKKLPEKSSEMSGQMDKLCRYCGHFREYHSAKYRCLSPFLRKNSHFNGTAISQSWKNAYREFHNSHPQMTTY